MANYRSRKVELFAIQALIGEDVAADYVRLIRALNTMDPRQRQKERYDQQVVALARARMSKGIMAFLCYQGSIGERELIYDIESGSERLSEITRREALVRTTFGLIDPRNRYALVEYNQRGAKARDIADLIETVGRTLPGFENLSFELTPMPAESFYDELDRFERIRTASVLFTRPNPGWGEYSDPPNVIAKESGAGSVAVEVAAPRNGSLHQQRGLVGYIKSFRKARHPSVKNASVTGKRPGDSSETTVSLTRHTEHRRVALDLGDYGSRALDSIDEVLRTTLDAMYDARGITPQGTNQ